MKNLSNSFWPPDFNISLTLLQFCQYFPTSLHSYFHTKSSLAQRSSQTQPFPRASTHVKYTRGDEEELCTLQMHLLKVHLQCGYSRDKSACNTANMGASSSTFCRSVPLALQGQMWQMWHPLLSSSTFQEETEISPRPSQGFIIHARDAPACRCHF